MKCDRCRAYKVDKSLGSTRMSSNGVSGQFCEACGDLLPVRDSVHGMLEKLTQLARFGLDAESRPMLADSDDG